MATFGERLKTLRLQRKLRQRELAEAVGIKRGTIGAWEAEPGRMPEINHIIKLADFFGVSIDYLLGKTDDPTPPGKTTQNKTPQNETNIDLETFLQKVLSGEIPIHFQGVDALTPEVEEDIRTILKVALDHIRLQIQAHQQINQQIKKAETGAKGVMTWDKSLNKGVGDPCFQKESFLMSARSSRPTASSVRKSSRAASTCGY